MTLSFGRRNKAQEAETGRRNAELITETLRSCALSQVMPDAQGKEEARFVFFIPIKLPFTGNSEIGDKIRAKALDRMHAAMEDTNIREKLAERVDGALLGNGYRTEQGSYDSNYPKVALTWPIDLELDDAVVSVISPTVKASDAEQWKNKIKEATLKAAFKLVVELNGKLHFDMVVLTNKKITESILERVFDRGIYSVPVSVFPTDKPSASIRPSSLMEIKAGAR